MQFQIFRYILTPVQYSLSTNTKQNSKQSIMMSIFNNKADFRINNREFAFRQMAIINNVVVGKIGKKTLRDHELRLEDIFIRKKEEEWPHRLVIINTDERIQTVAFEIYKQSQFNDPLNVLQSYRDYLNEQLAEYGWHIEFEPVIDKEIFWEVIDRYQGRIKAVEFIYYVPNLFGTEDALSQELDDAKKHFSAQKVSTELSNEDGNLVVPKSKFVDESVELIRKGGGQYNIKVKGYQKKISSKNEAKIKNIDQAEFNVKDEKSFKIVIDKLFDL